MITLVKCRICNKVINDEAYQLSKYYFCFKCHQKAIERLDEFFDYLLSDELLEDIGDKKPFIQIDGEEIDDGLKGYGL